LVWWFELNVDIHVHTKYSGHSLLKVETIAKVARQRGLHAVAITDHDQVRGAYALSLKFPTIIGEEISCDEGEVIGLFIRERIEGGPALEVMDRIRAQGGLVMIPHPFDSLRKGLNDEELCAKADLIEVFNSRVTRPRDNIRAIAFAKMRDIQAVVGSDAHSKAEIGRSWMEVDTIDDPKSFMGALKGAKMHTSKSPFRVHVQTKLLKFREVLQE
jgi:predicted metal-dependent phosphoesterase TrpH